MVELLEALAANEKRQPAAMERFIETLTALALQYEEEAAPRVEGSPSGVLKYPMEERGLRPSDLTPVLGSRSYVSQLLSGHRPIGLKTAGKLAAFFQVSPRSFLPKQAA